MISASDALQPRATNGAISVAPVSTSDWADVEAMLHDYLEWLRAVTGVEPTVEQPSFGIEIADPRAAYARQEVTLLVARDGARAIGLVAVQDHPDGTAELKRLYVRPVARGRGVADRLVAAAVETARRHGASAIWLETVHGPMDPAISVYRRHGFRTIDTPSAILLRGAVVMATRVAGGDPARTTGTWTPGR